MTAHETRGFAATRPPKPRRRRRRPLILSVVFVLLVLSEAEVVQTARSLAPHVTSSGLALFLVWGVPLLAVAAVAGLLVYLPRARGHRTMPEWQLHLFVAPCFLFLLACVGHAFFGSALSLALRLVAPHLLTVPARLLGLAVPFALMLYGAGFGQLWTRVERGPLKLPGLGPELAGLRVVQLSDIHAGGMVGPRRLRRIARQVAKLEPDLVVVTGDIVSSNPHEAEVVAPILGSLKAAYGVWACLGNHDHCVDGDAVAATLERAGVHVLRNRGEIIRRGRSAFWLAGVDDTWTHQNDMVAALAAKPEGMPVLLLAHDPDLWPEAVRRGVHVTLSGHTHGGQFGLVKLHPALSLARVMTRFTAGRFEQDGSILHVSRGTANSLPIRLGAPTEIGLFELMDGAAPETAQERA